MKEISFETIIPPIKEFEDLRGVDLSQRNLKDTPRDILLLTSFDSKTKWPVEGLPLDFNPEAIIEKGKDPGLGVRELHAKGVNGNDVNVAIIDQKLLSEHIEYTDRITQYEELGEQDYEAQMHGAAVASLFVGKECGIAPKANLYYEAVPCGRDFNYYSAALKKIIEHNNNSAEKIRVVSCSIGYSGKDEEGLDEWTKVLKEARDNNIIVVDANFDDINKIGLLVEDDKDAQERLGADINKSKIGVPTHCRTFASYKGEGEYQYDGKGGISWAVPYIAGLFTLALQINPELTEEDLKSRLDKTVTINNNGMRIVSPEQFISSIEND